MIKTVATEIVNGVMTMVMTTKYSSGKTVRTKLCPKTMLPTEILPPKK